MENNIIFADGLNFEAPSPELREKAPFIKGRISVRVKDFVEFLEKNKNDRGYVNIDLKQSKNGNLYCALNTWKPKPKELTPAEVERQKQIDEETNIPF